MAEAFPEASSRFLTVVFDNCDEEKKGYLSRGDVKVAMISLFGYKPCKFEMDDLMKTNVSGLTKSDFIDLMATKLAAIDKDEEIRHTFITLDRNCKGFLSEEDFLKAASSVSPHLMKSKIQMAVKELDADHDGRLSYRDFEYIMKFNSQDAL